MVRTWSLLLLQRCNCHLIKSTKCQITLIFQSDKLLVSRNFKTIVEHQECMYIAEHMRERQYYCFWIEINFRQKKVYEDRILTSLILILVFSCVQNMNNIAEKAKQERTCIGRPFCTLRKRNKEREREGSST